MSRRALTPGVGQSDAAERGLVAKSASRAKEILQLSAPAIRDSGIEASIDLRSSLPTSQASTTWALLGWMATGTAVCSAGSGRAA